VDELDVRIDTVGTLASQPDAIARALQVMQAELTKRDPEQRLHLLLHTDPTRLLVGLSTSTASPVEVSGSGYARQPYVGGGSTVKFPQAQTAWGTIEALLIFEGDTPLATVALDRARAIFPGDNIQVDLNLSFS
jgi:hypothetical protein